MIIEKKLPISLYNYGKLNYTKIYNLIDKSKDEVIVFNQTEKQYKNKIIFRKYNSYLNIPRFDKTTNKSYMYSDSRKECSYVNIPNILVPYHNYAKKLNRNFNQTTINFYQNGDDFIEPHSDCMSKLILGSEILIITLNQDETFFRTLVFQSRESADRFSFPLLNDRCLLISSKANKNYRHGIEKESNIRTSRISITFRQVDITICH